jgi:hypothetical protein
MLFKMSAFASFTTADFEHPRVAQSRALLGGDRDAQHSPLRTAGFKPARPYYSRTFSTALVAIHPR